MHTLDAPAGTTFHHNGDYSGDTIITQRTAGTDLFEAISVPFATLVTAARTNVPDTTSVPVTGTDVDVHDRLTDLTLLVNVGDIRFLLATRYRNEQIAHLERAPARWLYELALKHTDRWAAEH